MVNTKTRKAVYIPHELWEKAHAQAAPSFDSVTTVVKNILLAHFNTENNTKTSSIPIDDEQF